MKVILFSATLNGFSYPYHFLLVYLVLQYCISAQKLFQGYKSIYILTLKLTFAENFKMIFNNSK